MRALCRQSALTSPIASRLGPLLSRFAGGQYVSIPPFAQLTLTLKGNYKARCQG